MGNDIDARVDQILAECKEAVVVGLAGKTLTDGTGGVDNAEKLLAAFFAPKVKRRLEIKDNWDEVKAAPLLVAKHLGRICAILATGPKVSEKVAKAAAEAARADEHCGNTQGAGDWCL